MDVHPPENGIAIDPWPNTSKLESISALVPHSVRSGRRLPSRPTGTGVPCVGVALWRRAAENRPGSGSRSLQTDKNPPSHLAGVKHSNLWTKTVLGVNP